MRRGRLVELVTALADLFGKETSKGLFEGWYMALGDLTDQQIEAGIGRAMRESRFFPTPVEVRGFVTVPELDPKAAATLALSKVLDGTIDTRQDKVAGKVMAMVPELTDSWWLRRATQAEIAWKHKDFLVRYESLFDVDRKRTEALPRSQAREIGPITKALTGEGG